MIITASVVQNCLTVSFFVLTAENRTPLQIDHEMYTNEVVSSPLSLS